MAEGGSGVMTAGAGSAAPSRLRRKFYVAMSILFVILIFVGFWPSYYGPLMQGNADAPLILHVHGIIYIGWMLLFVTQTLLAARGQLASHRKLGNIALGYGALVFVLGLIVSFVAPVLNVESGEWTTTDAAVFLPIPLGDMVLFGGLLLAAAIYRSKPEIHKRLMLLATLAIVFAAAFRLQNAGVPRPAAIVVWFVPLVLAMAYDFKQRGRVHPVYWIGGVAMLVALLKMPLGESEPWIRAVRPLFESLTT